MSFIHIRFRFVISKKQPLNLFLFSAYFNTITLSVTGTMADGCVALKTTKAARKTTQAARMELRAALKQNNK
jgi:hypothetical protein